MPTETPDSLTSVKQSVESQFSQVAAEYASSPVHRQGAELEAMLELASLTGSERVLDAGCGPGHTALTFAPHAQEVIALDLSEAMLAQGRQLAKDRALTNVEFRKGDVERLPFEDGSLDLIVTRYSAHHWPVPEAALSEFRRTLRAHNGTQSQLLLADVVSVGDYATDTHLQAIEVIRDPSHVRDHTPNQWAHMIEAAGFRAEVSFTWGLRIDFQSWVARMRTPAANVEMIRTLLHNAPVEVQRNLQVEQDGSLTFQCALIRAIPIK